MSVYLEGDVRCLSTWRAMSDVCQRGALSNICLLGVIPMSVYSGWCMFVYSGWCPFIVCSADYVNARTIGGLSLHVLGGGGRGGGGGSENLRWPQNLKWPQMTLRGSNAITHKLCSPGSIFDLFWLGQRSSFVEYKFRFSQCSLIAPKLCRRKDMKPSLACFSFNSTQSWVFWMYPFSIFRTFSAHK